MAIIKWKWKFWYYQYTYWRKTHIRKCWV